MPRAIEIERYCEQVARPRTPALAWYKFAGLLVAAGFPALFWMLALSLLTIPLGIAISMETLISVGVGIAAICLAGAAVAMAGGISQDPSPHTPEHVEPHDVRPEDAPPKSRVGSAWH